MPQPPPRILFMGRIFLEKWGGVRELAFQLLKHALPLCEEQGRTVELLVPEAGLLPLASPALKEVVLPRWGRNRILWDHVTVSSYANRQSNAVLYNIKLVLPERLRIPGFTTIHDLMYFPQPAKYDWREYLLLDSLYMRLMVRRTVRRSPLTTVDSEWTARDARELFPKVHPARFRRMYAAVDPDQWTPGPWSGEENKLWEGLRARGVTSPFVFHSGGLSKRKNVSLLMRAFAAFHRNHPEYKLVLTGGRKPTIRDPLLEEAMNALPADAWVRLGSVSPIELKLLYQRAAFFVFPSLYEGFGLPVLEAQAAGCPVISSNATSLAEVAGDSALMFDPRDVVGLLAAMEKLTVEEERARLVALGRENIKRFDYHQIAAQWLAIADEVYSGAALRR